MPEDTPTAGAGATATEEPPAVKTGAQAADEIPPADSPKPITLDRELLTAEARKKIEEEDGKPVEDIPYSLDGEEVRPHSVLSLKFKVEAGRFATELDRFYNDMRKDVTLPGFRKGKAPVKLIRIRMGEDADKDAMTEVAVNTVRQELVKREIKALDDPRVIDWTIASGEPLEFEVEVEREPAVELTEYKGLEVEVEKREIGDEDVQEELKRLQNGHATMESAGEGVTVEAGQSLVIDLKVMGDKGQELKHLARSNHALRDFEEELPPEVAKAILGAKVGDEVKAGIKNVSTNRRGEEIEHSDTYCVTIRDLKVRKVPDLDDEFAKDLGEHETLAALSEAIREQLAEAEEVAVRRRSIARLLEAVVEKNPLEAPMSLITKTQYESMMKDSMQLSRMGLRLQDVIGDTTRYMKESGDAAEFWVKQSLLSRKLSEAEKLDVTDEDVENEIAKVAEESGRKPLAIRARLEAENQLDTFRESLVKKKIEDFLLENNTVKTVAPKPKKEEEEGEAKQPKSEAESADES